MAVRPEVPGYRIIGEVGRGGFAVVYRAEQLSLHREVALKVLSVLDMTDDEITRFERECDTLAQLDWHPNILRILDAGMTEEGRPYLSMELLEDGSIGARFLGRPMPVDDVIVLGTQISGALAAAHAAGVLHRDVKPANILIDRTGRYRLADFGIASIVGSSRSSSTGMAGTVGYLAPEIILGKKATARSDVYSLAATMHALVTGAPPFSRVTDESAAAAIARTLHEPAADLRTFEAPDWFAALIERALAKDPAQRYDTAEDFSAALHARGDQTVVRTLPAPNTPTADATIRRTDTAVLPIIGAEATLHRVAAPTEILDTPTIVRSATPPPPPPHVVPGVTPPSSSGAGSPRRGWRSPSIAAGIVTLALFTSVGVYAATRSSGADDASPVTTTIGDTDGTTGGTAEPSDRAPASTVSDDDTATTTPATDPVTGSTLVAPLPIETTPGAPTTTVRTRPGATTTLVASEPPVAPGSSTTVGTSSATSTTTTTIPATRSTPVPTSASTTTTIAPTTTTIPPQQATLSPVSQSTSGTPGQYVLSSTVSDRCVSVVWSIPALGRVHSANNGGNCWGTSLMQYDTGWNNQEGNVPPAGSYTGSLTVTTRAGVPTTRSFTLVVAPPPTTVPPPLSVDIYAQGRSATPGQYVLYNRVSDRCVNVVWSIPALNRYHSATSPANCWPNLTGEFDTGWFNNEANVPPPGSYAVTVTVTNRAGQQASDSFTLVVS